MNLSVIIPAHNEEGCIGETITLLQSELQKHEFSYEILVINDNSTDTTASILKILQSEVPELRVVENKGPGGFGMALRCGLANFRGDVAVFFMADNSDKATDLVHFYEVMQRDKVDCVFGSRFTKTSRAINYPWFKLILNRLGNLMVSLLFGINYNDTTNAFKMYRREVIEGVQPILSPHFNITVELPLKAIVRGYTYTVVPNDWIDRSAGTSKYRIKEMGSRYLFIIFYCLLEKLLSRGDYLRNSRYVDTQANYPRIKTKNTNKTTLPRPSKSYARFIE